MMGRKMYKLCDIMVREFKYLNKLQEDKILHEVGYRDEKGESLPHAGVGEIFGECLSNLTVPSFAGLEEQKKRPRANSIGVFEPPPEEEEEGQ